MLMPVYHVNYTPYTNCSQSYNRYRQGAMLAPIRLTNAAAQLPCGSGETQGDASPLHSTPPPPLRDRPRPYGAYRTGRKSVL
ncbi:MAG TPA: hypothetical protein VK140_01085 [Ktedonobacteraceae bacterium]|nr:hypothetical protein [Ktedonobacteraceae bacterium]